ncbi:beta-1,3-galactosyltransferase 2-like [Epinephelus fuscoguttatus]|uniref:beta-1,3-galactosyltransferase 2-like n=1 Tax=Epinephelus fuscoguttatus TaxID=293821 RepID=UPI0020CFED8C|nr:beta-1,3-galactosyltransferase 2-like [Epinephelus fuscoguttatus]XP_049419917.1 beta-1,3-galactosyltransferase 2-like [Epinephelus fuscoguttatus]
MLESVFAQGGQSQGMVDGWKLADSRRMCSRSWRHIFIFILVLAAVLFLYTNREEMEPDWNPSHWWNPFKSQQQHVLSANTTGSSDITGGSGPTETSSSAFPQTGNMSLSQVTDVMTTTPQLSTTTTTPQPSTTTTTPQPNTSTMTPQPTKASVVTQLMTPNETKPPTPVPYVSPGPYVVEYPYEYHFIINEPKKCEQQKPFLVLMVPLAPSNRAHRDIIRSTWGSESLVLGKMVQLFFMLGLHSGEGTPQLHEQLLQESREHQDLLQSNFLDCYKNLTIKTMVMMEWLDSYCSSASYAMKIDSDMFLNVHNLVNMLLNAPKSNYMTGLVARGAMVLRDPKSKWFLPVELYPQPQYPRYALGLGYVLSLDLPKKLVEASRHIKAFYIEDVYLGLCMQHLGIPPTDPPNWGYFQVFPVMYSRCAYSRLIATTVNGNRDRVADWKDFKKPGPYC